MLIARTVRYRRAFMPGDLLVMASGPIRKPETRRSSATPTGKLSDWTFVGARSEGVRADAGREMLFGVVFLVLLVTVPLARGRLTAFADLEIRRAWLAPAGIGVQILIISVIPAGSAGVHEAVHMFSYALLGAFAWSNRRVPGVPVIMLGGALNFIAIVANGGVMPADPDIARHVAGSEEFVNSGAMAHPHLLFLGDVFATPQSWPMYNVFSIGDIVILLGVVMVLHGVSGSRLAPRRLRRPAPVGA
jgi:hypothetical protein